MLFRSKGQYIGSTENPKLSDFIKDASKELEGTARSRWGIIQGYQKVNLDSLVKEGVITETERKAGSRMLDSVYDVLTGKVVIPKAEVGMPEVYPVILPHPSGQGYAVKVGKNSWISGGAGAFGGGDIGRFATKETALTEAKRLGYIKARGRER